MGTRSGRVEPRSRRGGYDEKVQRVQAQAWRQRAHLPHGSRKYLPSPTPQRQFVSRPKVWSNPPRANVAKVWNPPSASVADRGKAPSNWKGEDTFFDDLCEEHKCDYVEQQKVFKALLVRSNQTPTLESSDEETAEDNSFQQRARVRKEEEEERDIRIIKASLNRTRGKCCCFRIKMLFWMMMLTLLLDPN